MIKTRHTPLWVFLAFSAIETRKGALWLIWSSALFTLYCLPWSSMFTAEFIAQIFLIDDWSWLAMMLPITLWYFASLRWMDKHDGWVTRPVGAEV